MDSGRIKLGAFLGDCSKVSILTAIYAGKKIGVSSHVHGVADGDVPSFTYWAASLGRQPVEIYLDSATETWGRMLERRGMTLGKDRRRLLSDVFEMTADERARQGVKRGKIP